MSLFVVSRSLVVRAGVIDGTATQECGPRRSASLVATVVGTARARVVAGRGRDVDAAVARGARSRIYAGASA